MRDAGTLNSENFIRGTKYKQKNELVQLNEIQSKKNIRIEYDLRNCIKKDNQRRYYHRSRCSRKDVWSSSEST